MKCLRCGHEWTPRTNAIPDRCPKCTSEKWNVAPPAAAKCAKCGHEWQPRIEPKRCAKCLTKYWRGETTANPTPTTNETPPAPNIVVPSTAPQTKPLMKCPKCSYEWSARTDNPKNCPKCKAPLDGTPRVSAALGKVFAKRLAAMAKPIAPIEKPCDLLAAYEWTGPRRGWIGPDTSVVVANTDGLDPDEHYPVLETVPAPMSEASNNNFVLRGWVHMNHPLQDNP